MVVASTLALYANTTPTPRMIFARRHSCMMIGGSVGDWSMKQNQNKPLLVNLDR
jgi:hypothetical protein